MIFGCCPDGQTPAGGPLSEGCPEQFGCAVTAYGCCPDGVIAANGFKNEGCEAPIKTCSNSPHGCCPDGVTEAIGKSMYSGLGARLIPVREALIPGRISSSV